MVSSRVLFPPGGESSLSRVTLRRTLPTFHVKHGRLGVLGADGIIRHALVLPLVVHVRCGDLQRTCEKQKKRERERERGEQKCGERTRLFFRKRRTNFLNSVR